MEKLQQLMDRLKMPGTIMQIGLTAKTVNQIVRPEDAFGWEEYIKSNPDANIYFLSGVDPAETGRASDDQVGSRNYIVFDWDIRKQMPDCSDDDISAIGNELKSKLDADPLFKEYSAIVFSGNGLHIYYIGDIVDTNEKKREWKIGMSHLRNLLERVIGYQLDGGCDNLARIIRLPCSINNKEENHGRKIAGKILFYQDNHSPLLSQILDKGTCQLNSEKVARQSITNTKVADMPSHNGDDRYAQINKIPVVELVLRLFPEWETDGRNFYLKGTKKAKAACFVADSGNFIVHGGTHHFPNTQAGYSPFEFVKMMEKLDNKGTFEWFDTNYPVINDARANTPNETTSTTPIKVVSLTELYEMQLSPPAYLVDKLIPEQGITGLVGDPNVGKTWFALHVAHAVARGEPVLGTFETKQGAVLIIELDDPMALTKDRLYKLNRDGSAPIFIWDDPAPFYIKGDKLEKDEVLIRRVTDFIKTNKIKLVIVDTFRDIHELSENDSEKILLVLQPLKQITKDGECSILLTHHQKKAMDGAHGFTLVRGSTAITGMFVSTLQLREYNAKNQEIEVTQSKNKIGRKIDKFNFMIKAFELDGSDFVQLEYKEAPNKKIATPNDIHAAVLTFFVDTPNPELSKDNLKKEIKSKTGYPIKGIGIALEELKVEGLLCISANRMFNAEILELNKVAYGEAVAESSQSS